MVAKYAALLFLAVSSSFCQAAIPTGSSTNASLSGTTVFASTSTSAVTTSFNSTSNSTHLVNPAPPTSNSTAPASPSTSTSSSAPPASTLDPTTQQDINTIYTRRLPIITAGVITPPSNITAWLATLDADGKWPPAEINYATGCDAQRANWPAQVHWQRILTMAAAYHGGLEGGDSFVGSADLRAAITRAMDYWFRNDMATPACLDRGGKPDCPCGTPGFWNTNWFSNVLGTPKLVAQSCLLLRDTLTPTQLGNCTNVGARAYNLFLGSALSPTTLRGANTLDLSSVGIDVALLTSNATLIADAHARVHAEVVVQPAIAADGIKADGSFAQHLGMIYNGNYGKDYANDVLDIELAAGGTQFAASGSSKAAFATLIGGDQWMIYRNVITGVLHWDFSVIGRFISFPVSDDQATGSIQMNLTQVRQVGEEWNSHVLINFAESLSQDTPNANAGGLIGNRMFYANDYMVHRGRGFVTTLRMFSNRTKSTECTNAQNPLGFHLSDGTVYTYRRGDEYEDIAGAWDWNLIPGTTVDYAATPLNCSTTTQSGVESFVGGASTGKIGVAAMRYTNPLTQALGFQKAWVFFASGAQHVMVNSIRSDTAAPVFSVLDQRKRAGDVRVDGNTVSGGNFTGAASLWHDGIGYVFPPGAGTGLSVQTGPRTGNWSALGISTAPPPTVDLFAAWLSHANASARASYTAYPATASFSAFQLTSFEHPVVEVRNDGVASAAYDPHARAAGIVVWAAAGASVVLPPPKHGYASVTVTTDRAVVMMVDVRSLEVTLADPAQVLAEAGVNVTLGNGRKPRGWGWGRSRQLMFSLPSGGEAGKSVTHSFA